MSLLPYSNVQPEDLVTPKKAGAEEKLIIDTLLSLSGHPLRFPEVWRKKLSANFGTYVRGGSANHTLMAAYLGYMLAPQQDLGRGMTPREWWKRLLSWQMGEAGGVGDTQFFGDMELRSNTYDGWRIGSIAGVREIALRRLDHELIRLTSEYLTRYAAFLTLLAAPSWPQEFVHGRARVPYVAQSGARSTNMHYADDPGGLCLAELIDWPERFHPWPKPEKRMTYWFLMIFDRLRKVPLSQGIEKRYRNATGVSDENAALMRQAIRASDFAAFDRVASLLRTLDGRPLRFKAWEDLPFLEIRRWPGVVAAIHPRVTNGNTGAVMASVLRDDGRKVENVFPWSKAKPKEMAGARARFEGASIVFTAPDHDGSVPVPPAQPARVWRISGAGLL